MKVFISHSGDRSRALADKIARFLEHVLPAAEPWVSTGIAKGLRWEPEIAAALEATNVGVVCLTRESLDARWILFEAGALAKRLNGRVCTLLLDVEPEDVHPPLNLFQHTKAEREPMLKLVGFISVAASGVDQSAAARGL